MCSKPDRASPRSHILTSLFSNLFAAEVISGLSRLRLPRHAQHSLPEVPAILDLTLRIRRASGRKTVSDAKFLTGHPTGIMSFEIRNLKYQSE